MPWDPRLSADRFAFYVRGGAGRACRVDDRLGAFHAPRRNTDSPGLWTPRVSRRHDPSKVSRRRADGRQPSMTTGTIIGRRRCWALTQRPRVRRTICASAC